MENFEKHLTFYHSKNATLNAINAGIDNAFLAFILLCSFHFNDNPVWLIASTNIVTSDTPINQWSFDQIARKLQEALQNNTCCAENSTASTSQTALNATADKTAPGQYNGLPCTHPECFHPKTHATENCWTKKQNKEGKKKHKAKKAKKVVESSSESESSPDLDSDSDSEPPPPKKHHHAHQSQAKSKRTLRVLRASAHCTCSCHEKATMENVFIAHPDSGASNHMTHRKELFNPASFEVLSKPIPISLGDDSEVFVTGKGTVHLLFNVNGNQKEGCFNNVLFIPELKVTLLSVGQSTQLPHCKVIFNNNVCKYIDKNTNEVIARAFAHDDTDLYTIDATPVTQKVAANLASSPS